MQSRRMTSSTSSRTSGDKGKQSSSDCGKDRAPRVDDIHCMECNRPGHLRFQDASKISIIVDNGRIAGQISDGSRGGRGGR